MRVCVCEGVFVCVVCDVCVVCLLCVCFARGVLRGVYGVCGVENYRFLIGFSSGTKKG